MKLGMNSIPMEDTSSQQREKWYSDNILDFLSWLSYQSSWLSSSFILSRQLIG